MKVDENLVKQAIHVISPLIQQLLSDNNKKAIAIVVMAGQCQRECPDTSYPTIYKGTIGSSEKIDKYRMYAEGKAHVSWRTGLPSGVVMMSLPRHMEDGDCTYRGSWVITDDDYRIAVGISGMASFHDEYLSHLLIDTIFMLIDLLVYNVDELGEGIFRE